MKKAQLIVEYDDDDDYVDVVEEMFDEGEVLGLDLSGKLVDAQDLVGKETVTMLKMTDCNLSLGLVEPLLEPLKGFCNLTVLDLCRNNLGLECSQLLFAGANFWGRLQVLLLRDCCLGNFGAGFWGTKLGEMHSLRHVDFGENNISLVGARMLASGLGQSWSLEVFRLDHNTIGSEGFKELCEGVKQNASLVELNVAANGITSSGLSWLPSALESSVSLTRLILSENDLQVEGGRLLGKSILVSRSVMSLFCSRCSFGDGIAHLVEGLELNAILLELDLSENALTKKGLKALVAVINSNKTLARLAVDKLDDDAIALFSKAMAANQTLTQVALPGVTVSPNLQFLLNKNVRRAEGFRDALKRGNMSELQRLMSQQHVDMFTAEGLEQLSPLHLAVLVGAPQVQMLLDLACVRNQLSRTNASKENVVNFAFRKGATLEVLRLLLEYDVLHAAVFEGNLALVERLLECGADPNQLDERGRSAVHIACALGNVPLVRILLQNGADAGVLFHGASSLHLATWKGHTQVCLALLEFDPNLLEMPIQTEARSQEVVIVARGEARSAAVDVAFPILAEGSTPLHVAAFSGKADLCQLFLYRGANVSALTAPEETRTPLHYASTPNVCRVLLNAGAEMEALDAQGLSPAAAVLKNGHLDAFDFLVDNNANKSVALATVKSLDLRFQLRDVFPFWIGLSAVDRLRVCAGNMLRSVPKIVVSGGDDAVLQYLRDIGAPGNKVTWEGFKVITLGKEGSGKTHIFNLIAKQRYLLNKSTDGIEIHNIKMKNSKIPVTWFDFGGQEVFYSTHQFFLTSQCVYLLVFNLTDPEFTARLQYWLKCVESYTSDPSRPAKVLVVGTHLDQTGKLRQEEALAEVKKLLEGSSCVAAHCFISCVDGGGTLACETIEKGLLLAAQQAGLVERTVPKSYVVVAQWIRDMRTSVPHLTWEKMKGHFVGYDPYLLERACSFLHDMGEIFFNMRRDMVCLDVKWLAKQFCSLITFRHTWVRNGVIRNEELEHVWHGEDLSETQISSIMHLFEVFHVAFHRKKDNCWVIPSMLPSQEPGALLLAHRIQQERVYTLSILPKGVFGRLVTRVHEWEDVEVLGMSRDSISIKGENGQIARVHCENGTDIMLAVGRPPVKIFRKQEKKGRQSLLRLLVQELQSIFYEILPRCARQVKCTITCPHCLASAKPREKYTYLDYGRCLQMFGAGETVFDCHGTDVAVSLLGDDVTLNFVTLYDEDSVILEDEAFASGAFGTVFRGRFKGETRPTIAAKVLRFDITESEEDLFAEFRAEVSMMAKLEHPNILKLHGVMVAPLRLVVEYCKEGDLYHALKEGRVSDFAVKKRIATDVARGMLYLHSQNPPVAHRDLRSPNVFLFSLRHEDETSPCAKVADLGMAVSVTSSLTLSLLTWQWMSPEAYLGSHYDERCDLYSFGILLWEICCGNGTVPFCTNEQMRQRELIQEVMNNGLRPVLEPDVLFDNELGRLCPQLWGADPASRVSFKKCLTDLTRGAEGKEHRLSTVMGRAQMRKRDQDIPIKIQTHKLPQLGEISCVTRGALLGKTMVIAGSGSGSVIAMTGFDSVVFDNIPVSESEISAMCVVENNMVWVGSVDGIICKWNAKETHKIQKAEGRLPMKKGFSAPKLATSHRRMGSVGQARKASVALDESASSSTLERLRTIVRNKKKKDDESLSVSADDVSPPASLEGSRSRAMQLPSLRKQGSSQPSIMGLPKAGESGGRFNIRTRLRKVDPEKAERRKSPGALETSPTGSPRGGGGVAVGRAEPQGSPRGRKPLESPRTRAVEPETNKKRPEEDSYDTFDSLSVTGASLSVTPRSHKKGVTAGALQPHFGSSITCMCACDPYMFTGDAAGCVVLWKGESIEKQFYFSEAVLCCCLLSEKALWFSCGKELMELDLEKLSWTLLGVNDDGSILSIVRVGPQRVWCCSSNVLQIWDFSKLELIKSLFEEGVENIQCVALVNVHGRSTIWCGWENEVQIYDSGSGALLLKVHTVPGMVKSILDAGEDMALVVLRTNDGKWSGFMWDWFR